VKTFDTLYHEVNASYDPDQAYRNWQDYRRQVSRFMAGHNFKDQDILIVGSGHLNDLDMSLFELARSICLVDIDISASRSGLLRQGISGPISLLEKDLTGLNKTPLMTVFSQGSRQDKINILDDLKQEIFDLNLDTYDTIIILPLYSQLVLPGLITYCDDPGLIDRVMNFSASRIQILNFQLMDCLKVKGHLFVFADLLEYDTQSEEAQYLKAHKNHSMILEDHVQSYLMTYGYGLGSFGLLHLEGELKAMTKDYLIWPFNSDRLLLVQAMDLVKDS